MRRMGEPEKIVLASIFLILSLYLLSAFYYRHFIGDISDNILHMVNYKGVWEGKNPFWAITQYPMLFYFLPGGILAIEYLFIFVLLPLSLYTFAGIFFSRKLYRLYAMLSWLIIVKGNFIGYYGQIVGMFYITIFLYFWLRKKYFYAFPFAVLIPFGHNGTTLLLLAFCVALCFEPLLDRRRDKLILLFTVACSSLMISSRGLFIAAFLGVIGLVKLLPKDPRVILYPLVTLTVFANITSIEEYHYRYEYYYTYFDAFLEFYRDGDAYCFYTETNYDYISSPSRHVMRAWYYEDIPVKVCPFEHFQEAARKEMELRYNLSLEGLKRYER